MTTSEIQTWYQRREKKKWGQGGAITSSRVDIGFVENLDDILLLFPSGRVHLEISSDEELARHSSDYQKVFGRVVEVWIGR